MIRFQDVSLRYGAGPEILDRVSLDLAPGSFHFVIGASGAALVNLALYIFEVKALTTLTMLAFCNGVMGGAVAVMFWSTVNPAAS